MLFVLQPDNQCPEYLYHYTSIYVLFNILKKHELWLGNASMMNDKTEITEFYNSFKNHLSTEYPTKKEEINTLINNVLCELEGKYPFLMSFSTRRDDAAQWERYADNAKGVCIRFNVKKLAEMLKVLPLTIEKVYYGTDIQVMCPGDYAIFRQYFETGHIFNENVERALSQKNVAYPYEIMKNMMNFAARHKHKSFETENEYRLFNYSRLTCGEDIEKLDYEITKAPISIENECLNSAIKKIFKIKLDYLDSMVSIDDVITEIIIGSRSIQNLVILQDFVRHEGYEKLSNNITKSSCPLQ